MPKRLSLPVRSGSVQECGTLQDRVAGIALSVTILIGMVALTFFRGILLPCGASPVWREVFCR